MTVTSMAIAPNGIKLDDKDGSFSIEASGVKHEAELRSFTRTLNGALDILEGAENAHPLLKAPRRALGRVAKAVARPLRIAILGESNSGKSSLANLIIGDMTLPALPVANTRLPTLLQYAPVAFARAVHSSGERFALSASESVSLEGIIRIEVGLPSEALKMIELLDFPGSANPLFPTELLAALRHDIDAAIWATVATQAWRETERSAWMRLPERIRNRGLLAVTHCDLIATEEDFKKLRGRLEAAAKPHFSGMCFVAAPSGQPADAPEPAGAGYFSSQIRQLAQQFSSQRLGKGLLITRRLASRTAEQVGSGA